LREFRELHGSRRERIRGVDTVHRRAEHVAPSVHVPALAERQHLRGVHATWQ
jgi:hypothetical protein